MQAIPSLQQQLLEASATGICWIDAAGMITFANAKAAAILGHTAEALVGRAFEQIIQDTALTQALLAPATPGHVPDGEPVHTSVTYNTQVMSLTAHSILDPHGVAKSTLVSLTLHDAVTDIQQASAASEKRYRALFEAIDEGISTVEVQFDAFDQAVDYRFLAVNRAHYVLTGFGAEVVGKCITEVMPDIDPAVIQRMGSVALTGEPIRFEITIRSIDRSFEVCLTRVGHQESRTVAAVFRDISERKRREQQQAFLLKLSDALRPIVDPQEIQRIAADLLGEHLQVNQTNYGEMQGDYVHISHSFTAGLTPMVGTFRLEDFGKRLIDGHRAGKLQVCTNTTNDPQFDEPERAALTAAQVGAYIAVPLVKKGRWVGVLSVLNVQPREWTPTEVEAVQEVAERTWAAVERANAENALRKSEEKYRALFDSIDEGFTTLEVLFDAQGKAVDAIHLEMNPAYARHSGASHELVGKRLREVYPALEDRIFERYGQVARTGEPVRFEEHVALWDYWFDAFATRVGGEGSHIVAVVFNNITGRKRRERHAAFLDKLSQTLVLLDNPEEIIRATGNALCTHLDIGFLNIVEVALDHGADPAEARFTVVSAWERKGLPSPRGTYRAGDYLSTEFLRAARAGEPIVIADTDTDPRVDKEAYRAIGMRAFVAVPILKDGAWPGLISVFTPEPRDWRSDETSLIVEVGYRVFPLYERVRAEEALHKSEARLQALIENLPGCAVFVIDTELRYVVAEGEAITDTGLTPADLVGKTIYQALPEQLAAEYEPYFRSALAGEFFEFEHTAFEHVYLTRGAPLRSPTGEIYALLAACVDITDRKRAESELREVDKRKDEFIAMLAHELRNPLAVISSATQVMKRMTRDDASTHSPREIIERQLQHLTHLVDDLLDISRLNWGKIKLKREIISLASILQSAIEANRPLIDARDHQLTITLPPQAVLIDGDSLRLVQIFGNLLNNAAKYTDPGGQITLHTLISTEEAIVRVHDNGCGLSTALLSDVFELFTQETRTLDRSQGGLGLGLALVRSLVKMHGGTVEAHSAGLGQGSEFVVRLPLSRKDHDTEGPVPNQATVQAPAIVRPLKILVIEDNLVLAQMMGLLLRDGGDEVRLVHDGVAALDQLHDFQPHVVLCDIGLPGLTGYEIAIRLREMPECHGTLLVALTGYGRDEDRRQSELAGFDHHLTKPVNPDVLDALLQQRRMV